jgi:SAM-dependent methyltransferase
VGGIAFDRAADYYDATRRLPDSVRDRLADLLADELRGHQPCLEIGVGTGRIALPLHDRGIALVGIDLARPMLDRLVANAGGHSPFPLVHGDVTRLPLGDGVMGSVIASHLLHLVSGWRQAVDEAMRVVRPEGALYADFGGGAPTPWSAPTEEVFRRRGIVRHRPGVSTPDEVSDHLGSPSAVRRLPALTVTVRRTLRLDLDEWERQIHSWTWAYTAEQMSEGCDDVRAWAAGEGWPLDREVELERSVQWWAFDSAR